MCVSFNNRSRCGTRKFDTPIDRARTRRPNLLQCLPAFDVQIFCRTGPVHEVEIHVVQPEPLKALLKRGKRSVGALVVIPQLRGDEQVFARYPGTCDCLPDTLFVVVDSGGVDVAIPEFERIEHHLCGLARVNLEYPQSQLRDGAAVIQGKYRNRRYAHRSNPFCRGYLRRHTKTYARKTNSNTHGS